MATAADVVAGKVQQAASKNNKQATKLELELLRRRIYATRIPAYNLMRSETGKVLPPAPAGLRKGNFEKFVKLYFYNLDHSQNTDPFHADYGMPTRLTKGSSGYKAFERFALTDYGSYVIKTMIDKPDRYKGFKVWENAFGGAHGDYHFISLPKDFPARETFLTSGQRIHDLAIIYHEFAHTMMFRSPASKDTDITIYDEREAVLKFENPVRIRDNYEPRYTYTKRDGSQTINIITREVKPGKWSVRKDDPAVLVKPDDKDALA